MQIRPVIERMRRIMLIASKPDKLEYKQTVKITGLGFLLIGVVGFVIFLAAQLISGI